MSDSYGNGDDQSSSGYGEDSTASDQDGSSAADGSAEEGGNVAELVGGGEVTDAMDFQLTAEEIAALVGDQGQGGDDQEGGSGPLVA